MHQQNGISWIEIKHANRTTLTAKLANNIVLVSICSHCIGKASRKQTFSLG